MFQQLLVVSVLLASAAHAAPVPASTAPSALPTGQSIADVADNPYFRRGVQAAAAGLTMVSVAIDALPAATLDERMNAAHLGLGAAGWTLAGQSSIEVNGTTSQIVLTYRR